MVFKQIFSDSLGSSQCWLHIQDGWHYIILTLSQLKPCLLLIQMCVRSSLFADLEWLSGELIPPSSLIYSVAPTAATGDSLLTPHRVPVHLATRW